jgi:hypothetical protein
MTISLFEGAEHVQSRQGRLYPGAFAPRFRMKQQSWRRCKAA